MSTIIGFPGASTPGNSIGASNVNPAFVDNNLETVKAFKDTATGQFEALKNAADAAKGAAETAIESAMSFDPGSAPPVEYIIPASEVVSPSTLTTQTTLADASFTPVAMASFQGAFTPGDVPSPASAQAPVLPSVTLTPLPTQPAAAELTAPAVDAAVLSAPQYSAPTFSAPELPLSPANVIVTLPEVAFGASPQALTVTAIDLSTLSAAKARLEIFLKIPDLQSGTPKEYSETFAPPRDMLSEWSQNATLANKDTSNKQRLAGRRDARFNSPVLERLWQGRGVVRPSSLRAVQSSYVAVTNGRETLAQNAADEARQIRYVYEEAVLQREAYLSLFTAVNELDQQRLQLDVDVIAIKAAAEVEKIKASISDFNAQVSLLAAQAEAYAAQLQTYDANVRRFKAEVEAEATKGAINEARARTFSAQAQAESSKRQAFDAALSVEKQKLDALASQISARGVTLSKAQTDLEKYKASALVHSSKLVQARGEIAAYSARSSAVAASNRAQAAKARVESAKTQLVAQDARRELARVEAENATLRAQIITRTAQLQETISENSAAAVTADALATQQSVAFAKAAAPALGRRANAGLAADAAQAASRFVSTAANAASQATQLSQSVNNTLANAYAALYESAGRAAAAVSAGEFSGFRAAKSVSASYSNTGSKETSSSQSAVRQVSTSQEDAYSVEGGV